MKNGSDMAGNPNIDLVSTWLKNSRLVTSTSLTMRSALSQKENTSVLGLGLSNRSFRKR